MTDHFETGHGADGETNLRCTCTLGIDHGGLAGSCAVSDPPTVLGKPAATCRTCGALRQPPRVRRGAS